MCTCLCISPFVHISVILLRYVLRASGNHRGTVRGEDGRAVQAAALQEQCRRDKGDAGWLLDMVLSGSLRLGPRGGRTRTRGERAGGEARG